MTEATERKDIAKLAKKLAEIGAEIGAMMNDGKNKQSNYGFISYKAMEAELRKLCAKHKIAMIPQITEYEDKVLANDNGKHFIRSIVKGTMLIVDGETGASIEGAFVGADQDYGGKSMGQAVTEATKRFYFKLFHVSDKEADPDERTFDGNEKPEGKVPKKMEILNACMKKNKCGQPEAIKILNEYYKQKLGKDFSELKDGDL